MKVAFLILAHHRPHQLARLVEGLPSDSPIFVHFDGRAKAALFRHAQAAVLASNSSTKFVKRHKCWWGAPGLMWATLELISVAIKSRAHFDYATLLSGQDYPIKSESRMNQDLVAGGEFIESFNMLQPNRWTGEGRMYGAPDKVVGRFLRFRSRIVRVGSRKMPDNITPYGGSQWWTLSYEALDYVDHVRRNNEHLMKFLAGTFIPDESFMQTILGSSPVAERIRQDNLRLEIWDRLEPPFPAVLSESDLPIIAASTKHFARKFDFDRDPQLPKLLDELDLSNK